ncbi:MAG: ABC transporter permease [Lachnospiraceae bacterium]|nr:ABC transporter permease [Lachnospiraceae bacterium]
MNKVSLIIKKELYRVFGDRKLIFSLYVLPVIITIAIYSLMGSMIGKMTKDITEHTSIVTVVNATGDFKWAIDQSGFADGAEITYIDSDDYATRKNDIEEEIKNGNIDLVVNLPENFDEDAKAYMAGEGGMPSMDVYYNADENYSSRANSVFNSTALSVYKNSLLSERYGDVDLLEAVNINTVSLSKDSTGNATFMKMLLPYMVIMILFAGVMSVGVDAIAGEKERGTLASMLISPVKRREIAAGKMISMAILSGISAVVTTGAMVLSFTLLGSNSGLDGMGFSAVNFSAAQIIELLLIMLSLVLFYVSVISLIAVYSGNTKTANSVISPIYMVIILMGMMTMFRTGSTTPSYLYAIPVYGNALAISDITSNELGLMNFIISFVATIGLGAIITVLVTKAFNNEKLMFNA